MIRDVRNEYGAGRAVKWDKVNVLEVIDFCGIENVIDIEGRLIVKVQTPIGKVRAVPGDYFIKNGSGLFVFTEEMMRSFYGTL